MKTQHNIQNCKANYGIMIKAVKAVSNFRELTQLLSLLYKDFIIVIAKKRLWI